MNMVSLLVLTLVLTYNVQSGERSYTLEDGATYIVQKIGQSPETKTYKSTDAPIKGQQVDKTSDKIRVNRRIEAPDPANASKKIEVNEEVTLNRADVKEDTKDPTTTLIGWLVVIGALLAVAWAWYKSKSESAEMKKMDEEFTQAEAAETSRQPVGTH
jgi:hypothetical protein